MHRIDGDGHVANQFSEGDPGSGVPATLVTDDWLNAVQEEIVGVVEAAGLTPSKADNGQLLAALDARFGHFAGTQHVQVLASEWLARLTNVGDARPAQINAFAEPYTDSWNSDSTHAVAHVRLPAGAKPTAVDLLASNGNASTAYSMQVLLHKRSFSAMGAGYTRQQLCNLSFSLAANAALQWRADPGITSPLAGNVAVGDNEALLLEVSIPQTALVNQLSVYAVRITYTLQTNAPAV